MLSISINPEHRAKFHKTFVAGKWNNLCLVNAARHLTCSKEMRKPSVINAIPAMVLHTTADEKSGLGLGVSRDSATICCEGEMG